MRLGLGLFAALASLIALSVAVWSLPLSVSAISGTDRSALAVVLVHYLSIGFCLLGITFGALVMVSDDWISLIGYGSSAAMAALLATLPVATPLLLAMVGIGWLVLNKRYASADITDRSAVPAPWRGGAISDVPVGAATPAHRRPTRVAPRERAARPARLYPMPRAASPDPAGRTDERTVGSDRLCNTIGSVWINLSGSQRTHELKPGMIIALDLNTIERDML